MSAISDLLHAVRPLPSGGEVLVLETGATIKPESQAMLGAMYSRSSDGIRFLLKRIETRGPDAFLRQNYQIGYGHKSIGDLGEAAIFIDGVSMLCAKAIQDFPLYRGQESSTRYIDFSKQRFQDPGNSVESARILERWRSLYLESTAAMVPYLIEQFSRNEGEDEKVYDKTIKARAFDVTRAFLPAGATTNVAWMGDLRHINDHLRTLRTHPLKEVRGVALAVEDALIEKFPSSFGTKRYEATEIYMLGVGRRHTYLSLDDPGDFILEDDTVDRFLLGDYRWALENRPEKTELPFAIRECGGMRFGFLLDFGSFRDLQRQRAVSIRMPLLDAKHGFEPWYLDQLPGHLYRQTIDLINEQVDGIDCLGLGPELSQYYMPMGMRTNIRMAGDLRALVYLVELRTSQHVHQTLRVRAQQTADVLMAKFGSAGLVLHTDQTPTRFDLKRGTHDIVEKA